MGEQRINHAVMAVPPPGFTDRVMARIQERERVAARRRAVIGLALLIFVTAVPLVLLGLWLVSTADALTPEGIISTIIAMIPALNTVNGLLEGVWVAASVVAQVASVPILIYGLFVCALTVFWVRVVNGSFRTLPHTVSRGG